jgi:hypothetical protein
VKEGVLSERAANARLTDVPFLHKAVPKSLWGSQLRDGQRTAAFCWTLSLAPAPRCSQQLTHLKQPWEQGE